MFKLKALALFVLSFCYAIISNAQQGFSGKVIDAGSGEPISDATIFVPGLGKGAKSDIDGNYSFEIEPGIYNLGARANSFKNDTVFNKVIVEKKFVKVDFLLLLKNSKTVSITVEEIKNTDASLISLVKKAESVQDFVSSAQLTKTGSSNAADATKQITGANIQDGKYVVMRGLGDRYSITQLNGLTMVSTDPYRNSTSLDLIPASMIDNLITSKTFTPEQPGNFSGGNLNITTRTFPDKLTISFSTAITYNPQVSFNDEFRRQASSSTDFLGMDDGKRGRPSTVTNPDDVAKLTGDIYLRAQLAAPNFNDARDYFNSSARSFSNDYVAQKEAAPLGSNYAFSIGNKHNLGTTKDYSIGYTVGLNYSQNYEHYSGGKLNTFVNTTNGKNEPLFAFQNLEETKSTFNPNIGGLANVSFRAKANTQVDLMFLYSNDAEIVSRSQQGEYYGAVSNPNHKLFVETNEFLQRTLTSTQLNFKHIIPHLNQLEIKGAVSFTRSQQLEPNLRYLGYLSETTTTDSGSTVNYFIPGTQFELPNQFYRQLTDSSTQARLDFTFPLDSLKNNKVSFGMYFSGLKRNFNEYRYRMSQSGVEPNLILAGFDPNNFDEVFNSSNFGIVDTVFNADGSVQSYKTGYFYLPQATDQKNSYRGSQNVYATYVVGSFALTQSLRMVTGARLEVTDISVINGENVESKINAIDVLPSFNFIQALSEKSNLRVALTSTLARPNLRELAPFAQFDPKNGFFNNGNPNLVRTNIYNADVRYEIFPNYGENISVSGYYKRFVNPIIRTFDPSQTTPTLTYINVPFADVAGVEFEFRKKLGKYFSIGGNLSGIWSQSPIPDNERQNSINVDSTYTLKTRPFQGQAPYIVNALVGYQNDSLGLDMTLSFNVAGRNMYSISLQATPDIYELERPNLVFKVSKDFAKHFNASLTCRNLLNARLRRVQDFRGTNYISEDFRFGPTFTLTVGYKL